MQNISFIYDLINRNVTEEQLNWINGKAADYSSIQISFVAAPRFVGKQKISSEIFSTFENTFENWSIDRLVRVYFLLILEKNSTSEGFNKLMKILFETAEINESVALFSALPYFQNPIIFLQNATDAVRSNVGDIFDSIAFENSFPTEYFSELAWNQLVLKCIFNDKPIHRIIGLEKRANKNLANTLSDFAHERWAAGRSVPAQVWRLVVDFVDDNILRDIQTLFKTQIENNLIAAVLVCQQSNNQKAKVLLDNYLDNVSTIFFEKINWKYLEGKE